MNSFDQSKPMSPADAHAMIGKVAALLGVQDPADHDAIEGSLTALFGAAGDRGNDAKNADPSTEAVEDGEGGEAKCRAFLTAGQLKAIDAAGCSARDFLSLRLGKQL